MDPTFWRVPTDNLYKFLALSGLVAVLVALIYPIAMINKLEMEVEEIAGDVGIAEAHTERLTLRATALRTDSLALNDTQIAELADATFEARRAAILGRTRNKKLGLAVDHIRTWVRFAVALGGVGFGAMVFGFVQWYLKIQRFEDAILERRAVQEQKASTDEHSADPEPTDAPES